MSPPARPKPLRRGVGPEVLSLPFEKYRPDQPRAPRGTPDGGQWVDEGLGGGGSGDDPRVLSDAIPDDVFLPGARVAQNEKPDRYRVDLRIEDDELGGHTLSRHVKRQDEELLDVVRRDRYVGPLYTIARRVQGSFLSLEDANNFVNRVLEENKDAIDAVASGARQEAEFVKRFGYVTGKEAFRPHVDADPFIRPTYEVYVHIQSDRRAKKGYRVFRAFPKNAKPVGN